MESSIAQAQNLLNKIYGKTLTRKERIDQTCQLAALLFEATLSEKTREEKKHEAWMDRMMDDPQGRAFLTEMIDQIFRSQDPMRTVDQLTYLIHSHGIPRFFRKADRLKFLAFSWLGKYFPQYFAKVIRKQVRKEAHRVLLPDHPQDQLEYLKASRKNNIRLNINHLGEAILGEREALRRLNVYLEDLANPQIDYISVKISTIFSQINLISYTDSLHILADRLRLLYHTARPNGKFVNLDMEEYKDLHLTVDVFKQVLSEPQQLLTTAGIVLQSYLPDTFSILRDLTD